MKRVCLWTVALAISATTIIARQAPAPKQPTFINVGALQVSVDAQLANSFPAYVGEGPAIIGPAANPGETLKESYTVQTDDGRIWTYTGGAAAATGENVLAQLRVRIRNTGTKDERMALGEVTLTCGSKHGELLAVGRGGHPFAKRSSWLERAQAESVRLTQRTMSMYTYVFVVGRGSGECRVTFRNHTLETFTAPQR